MGTVGTSHSTQVKRELAGVALVVLALFIAASFAAGAGADPGPCSAARGAMGPVGACLRASLLAALGLPAALLVPLLPLVHALRLFGRLESRTDRSWLVFLAGVVAILPIVLALAANVGAKSDWRSGLWGSFVAYYLTRAFGSAGAWIVLALLLSALTVLTLAWNPMRVLLGGARVAATGSSAAPRRRGVSTDGSASESASTVALSADELSALAAASPASKQGVDGGEAAVGVKTKRLGKAQLVAQRLIAGGLAASEAPKAADPLAEELPAPTLLSEAPSRHPETDKHELDAMAAKLKEALRTFRVEAEIVGRTTGPVVTQFEVKPAPGVKVRQIANLANDLALAMRAPSIRIVAPIPGRGAVGVEVPNPTAEVVDLRELLERVEFQAARATLPIAVGKDLEGRPVIADLARMPHLLIAGATGSGKSVCINTLITSLIFRHTPRTLRFLMVDPKMVELSGYNRLPHLRHKVITDNRDAAKVLKWAIMEMEERYRLFAENGCRNIHDFNRRVERGDELRHPKSEDVAFEERVYRGGVLPYIVVVIDELADLMMTVQGEVETPLALLAQKARAIGLHLIVATQRPSVNVITGLIKANFPSRIAFRVASQVDSRTILDGIGAEALLGNGDMLFVPPGKSEPARIQGAYISSEDTERLMKWYEGRSRTRDHAAAAEGRIGGPTSEEEPDILTQVREREAQEARERESREAGESGEDGEPGDRDKLFREAAEVVIQHQQGSTSLLQRRLKVGYGRAARIIDQLHEAGVLGPPDASKPRDVLVGLEDLDRICGARDS